MHRLHRDPVAPIGLSHYRHGLHSWSKTCPTAVERADIWDKLNAMQGQRCAYCEGPMGTDNRHIEHFRQRARYPQGTFDWHNLFGSCARPGTCGDRSNRTRKTRSCSLSLRHRVPFVHVPTWHLATRCVLLKPFVS